MSTVRTPDQPEVNPDRIVTDLASELEGDTDLVQVLIRGTQETAQQPPVHTHYLPDDIAPKLIVVRLRDQAGGVSPSFIGREPIDVQTMLMAAPDVMNRRLFFNEAKRMIRGLLTGFWFESDVWIMERPLKRVRTQREPRFDTDVQRWYTTDTYFSTIRPR